MNADTFKQSDTFGYVLLSGTFVALYLSYIPLTSEAQLVVAIILLSVILILKNTYFRLHEESPFYDLLRVFLIICGVFVTLRYFTWRTTNTLNYHDPVSFAGAITLYLAELYGIAIYFLGGFVNLMPLRRKPITLPEDRSMWPSVDVLIPSYNEDPDLLEVTLIAATQIDYPSNRLNVYLLDDGGTVQKRNDMDPNKASAAWERFLSLQELCQSVGANYLTRDKNEHAKAGNINAALPHCHGDLVLILDADHVPTADILKNTVGHFVHDEKMFLVQTPHYFINPDPIEKNLDTYASMPSENEMFYSVIQHGLDFWNASFFCGSAAILRRCHLTEVGGIAGDTITEDAETALKLHSLGYRSAYVGKPMISGLQPETFTGFILQRVRWAQGMMQIFMLKNPWRNKTLSLWQKLGYTNSTFFWFFPFARTVFLLAPAAFLIFGLKIYDANLTQFFVYAVPHLIGSILIADLLYGKVRWTFISELYETMQSLFSLVAISKVVMNPRAPKFNVTPKGEHLEDDFVSSLYKPFYALVALCVISLIGAVYRYANFPQQHDVIIITSGWTLFNLVFLLAALGALLERKQRRKQPRVRVNKQHSARILLGENIYSCEFRDIAPNGAGLELLGEYNDELVPKAAIILATFNPVLNHSSTLNATIRGVFTTLRPDGSPQRHIGIEFQPASIEERREIISLAFGDSEQLMTNLRRRQTNFGIAHSIDFIFRRSLTHAGEHLAFRIQQLTTTIAAKIVDMAASLGSALSADSSNKHSDTPVTQSMDMKTIQPRVIPVHISSDDQSRQQTSN